MNLSFIETKVETSHFVARNVQLLTWQILLRALLTTDEA